MASPAPVRFVAAPGPRSAVEVGNELGVEVMPIPYDPKTLRQLERGDVGRRVSRSQLVRFGRTLLDELADASGLNAEVSGV